MLSAKTIARLFVLLLTVQLLSCTVALGQTEEMAVADEVNELHEKLKAASFEERDEAEKEIIKLGTAALDHIADPSPDFEEDLNKRLVRVRKQLEQVAIEEAISPSRITLDGKMSLKDAFLKIKRQTGNVIALAEGYDPVYLEKQIDLDLKDATFWTALAELTSRGGLEATVYGGALGQMSVVPKPGVDPEMVDKAITKTPLPLDESGIFRIRVISVSSAKNLRKPELDYTRVDLEIQWEPRLSPISIDMALSKVKVIDEEGNELKVSNPDQVLSGTVQQGVNQVDMSLTLENVDREIKKIASVTGQLDAVLPGRREKFRFARLGGIEGDPVISKAGISVQYLGFEANEDLYAVNVRIAMESSEGGFESHLGWVYDNPLFLIDEAGKKEPSIGHQGGGMDEDGLMIQYLFVEEPTRFGLLYESPGAIVSVPAEITLKDIPLP